MPSDSSLPFPCSIPSGARHHEITPRTAIILSGGGARGAYEVGVLSYLFDDFARLRGGPPRVDILSGTSVGAINACHLAANFETPESGVRRLVNLWSDLDPGSILGLDARAALRMRHLFSGGNDGAGLFDVSPIISLVHREISWHAMARTFRHQKLQALTVSATEVATGRTAIFMQTAKGLPLPTRAPPRTVFHPARIGPQHALASAAIPVLFPPVRVGGALYVDGGVRQNTPIMPALRLGATRVLAVGLSRDVPVTARTMAKDEAPGAAFLMGKVLNALLLDHLSGDLELLDRINCILADGERAFGPEFLQKLNESAYLRGGAEYRPVQTLALRPSEDIGQIAADHVARSQRRGSLLQQILRALDDRERGEADLASYLLFDGKFAADLIHLGRRDARAHRDELLEFFDIGSTPQARSDLPEPSSLPPDVLSVLPPPIEGA